MYWYPVGLSTDLAYLPFNQSVTWDAALGKNAKVIRSHRNFLFMLNLTEEVNGVMTEMTDSYRWSHPADANSIPATWDETDLAFSAGLASLGDHTGAIIDGASLRDSFVIYSEGGINVLDYSGDSFVWNRRQVTTTASLLAKDCVVEVLGAHFYLSPGDIMRFDGHSVTSIMQSRIREHLQANLTGQNYKNCIVVSNLAMKEIWFCIPKVGSTWPDLVYVYNWADESWAIRELRENVSYLAYGSKSNPVLTWKALELRDPTPTWQSYDAPWGSATSTPFDDTMLAVTTTGEVYDTDTAVPDGDLHTELKRTDMAFNPHRQVSTITKVHPMIQTSGSVYFSVGSQDYPGGPVRWKPKILLSSKDTHRRLNVRTTGALHAWKLESVANATFTFTGLEIEYSEAGVR
jgi:hypothetical protein